MIEETFLQDALGLVPQLPWPAALAITLATGSLAAWGAQPVMPLEDMFRGMTLLFMLVCLGGVAWIFKTGYRLKS